METEDIRRAWKAALITNFSQALRKSTQYFTWQEKADFLDVLVQYVQLLQKTPNETGAFASEKIMKPFRTKLDEATKEGLFKYFYQDIAFVELNIITTETFNSLPYEERGMSDGEFEWYLRQLLHAVQMHQLGHYTLTAEDTKEENLQGVAVKGRPQRTAGDNLTKLNQEQTALLIDYFKKGRIILKDEYLTDKTAGYGFHILTGYSPDSLRIRLNKKELSKVTHTANLREVYNALIHVTNLIANDLK